MTSSQPTGNHSSVTLVVAVVLAIWLALVFLLGAGGADGNCIRLVRPSGGYDVELSITGGNEE